VVPPVELPVTTEVLPSEVTTGSVRLSVPLHANRQKIVEKAMIRGDRVAAVIRTL
jgi:hypothetical protein